MPPGLREPTTFSTGTTGIVQLNRIQVEPLLGEIVLTISHDGDMEDQAQLLARV
jgi:hypothetical protein